MLLLNYTWLQKETTKTVKLNTTQKLNICNKGQMQKIANSPLKAIYDEISVGGDKNQMLPANLRADMR